MNERNIALIVNKYMQIQILELFVIRVSLGLYSFDHLKFFKICLFFALNFFVFKFLFLYLSSGENLLFLRTGFCDVNTLRGTVFGVPYVGQNILWSICSIYN